MELTLFLLGYPLGIIANISTDFLKKYFIKYDNEPLKKLFIESFFDTLKNNENGVDKFGRDLIVKIKKIISTNKDKLFNVIIRSLEDPYISIIDFRKKDFIESLIQNIMNDFDLLYFPLAKQILQDCFRNYEKAFYLKMTEKEGIQFVLNILRKLDSDVAKKSDLEKLRVFIQKEFNKKEDKTFDGILNKDIYDAINDDISNPESEFFSTSITKHMALLKKKVEKLTQDQFQIIHYLRHRNRVVISGCAGSGKTLLVAEKALRLSNMGIKTLITCHNPYLANHIKKLVAGSSVNVSDFTNFILSLIKKKTCTIENWNEYIEPLETDINDAFDEIIKNSLFYDAVIVDEGQDFRELWWLIIESLLEGSKHNILYIFYDDNQALLPFRSKYPIKISPFTMSKNCRNGGEIFEIVRKFHANAPLTSVFLSGRGFLKFSIFSNKDYTIKLENALRDAYRYASHNQIVIITNEPSANTSIINGYKFNKTKEWSWRTVVENDLYQFKIKLEKRIKSLEHNSSISEISNRFCIPLDIKIEDYLRVPSLSDGLKPSKKDIKIVKDFASRFMPLTYDIQQNDNRKSIYWKKDVRGISLWKSLFTGRPQRASILDKIVFYSSNNWADSIPIMRQIEINAIEQNSRFDEYQLPLYSIDSFKGLEADAVILFIISMNELINSELYIGVSRAIGYLHVVISSSVFSEISQLGDPNFIDKYINNKAII